MTLLGAHREHRMPGADARVGQRDTTVPGRRCASLNGRFNPLENET